jgi:aminoglycoside phosphotransferase (APT) family kinase protein
MTDADAEYFERIVDEESLRAYLTAELGAAETYDVRHHQEGHSNETLFVTWGDRELVIRRPPPGDIAENAHDVLREYQVIDALQETDVRVPVSVLACDDHSVIGSDFYAMEQQEGDVLRDEEPDRFANPAAREQVGYEAIDRLVEIHQVDYEAVGLEEGEFGYPPGFTERQVRRWSEQLMWAFQVTADDREVEDLYTVMEWLYDNVPDDEEYPNTLVHGDYKLDNLMFGPGEDPEIAAIFDWEMSTLGDPFTDLGWLLSYWRDEGDPESPLPSLAQPFLTREGYPTRRELVDRYERKTGFDFDDATFYWVLAAYKLAGLGEMFYRRYLEGNSADPMYPKMEEGVPALAEHALAIINGELTL